MAEEEKTPLETKEADAKATSDLSAGVYSLKIEENGDNKEATAEDDKAQLEGEDQSDEDEEIADLDDDEIEENPAYIPKKGRYYMHDSRDEGGIGDYETKKSRADGSWSHDRYVERWQIPKSKKQIVAKYGFDIRDGETEEEALERHQKELANENEQEESEDAPPPQQNRRGRGGQFQRGRGGPRRDYERRGDDADDQNKGGNEDFEERAGERRQRGTGRPAMVRNVRGGRGTYTNTRGGRGQRNFDRPPRNFEREEGDRPRGGHDGEDMMENHRRGATRGTVRGFNAQPARQFTRTFSASRGGGGGGGPRHSSDSREGENGNHREPFEERRAPGGYMSNRSRGGRGAFRGTSNRGGGGFSGDNFRGNAGPKRYSMQRQDGPPPPRHFSGGNTDVVYFDAGSAPPPQPGPVVYFDPSQQQQQPRQLPPREKKIIEIRNPN